MNSTSETQSTAVLTIEYSEERIEETSPKTQRGPRGGGTFIGAIAEKHTDGVASSTVSCFFVMLFESDESNKYNKRT